MTRLRVFLLTAFAMIPLAANSWLARAALRDTATVQLSVPVIVAIGGVILLSEPIKLRLALATAAVLGGIGRVILERQRRRH